MEIVVLILVLYSTSVKVACRDHTKEQRLLEVYLEVRMGWLSSRERERKRKIALICLRVTVSEYLC